MADYRRGLEEFLSSVVRTPPERRNNLNAMKSKALSGETLSGATPAKAGTKLFRGEAEGEPLNQHCFLLQLLGLVMRGESVDDLIERAVHHQIKLVNRQADPVIRDAILFEVIGTNFF